MRPPPAPQADAPDAADVEALIEEALPKLWDMPGDNYWPFQEETWARWRAILRDLLTKAARGGR